MGDLKIDLTFASKVRFGVRSKTGAVKGTAISLLSGGQSGCCILLYEPEGRYEPRSKLLAWRRDIDLGVIVFLVSPIVLQIKPNVRIRLSGLGLLHEWEILEVLGSSTTLVLEMPRLGSWLDCAWL